MKLFAARFSSIVIVQSHHAGTVGKRAAGRASAPSHNRRAGHSRQHSSKADHAYLASRQRQVHFVQRLEDVTFLDAVVDCSETSLSNLGEVSLDSNGEILLSEPSCGPFVA